MILPAWIPVLIGIAAACCTTGAFVPQLHRVWQSRRAADISGTAFLVLAIGSVGWAVYGVLILSIPVILANTVTFALVVWTLVLKIRYTRHPAPAPGQPAP